MPGSLDYDRDKFDSLGGSTPELNRMATILFVQTVVYIFGVELGPQIMMESFTG